MKRYGLIGYPLSHSFSKRYFAEKFQRSGLDDCEYELFPIKSIDELLPLISQTPDLLGLNVTIPYKQVVLSTLFSAENIPDGIFACNCLKIVDGKLYGYNTDIVGFEKSFVPHLKPHHQQALVLGNGGATAAVTYVLAKFGISYQVVSRAVRSGSDLTYADMSKELMGENLIIINTTPLGTYPNVDSSPMIPYQFITPKHYLFDLVYNPEKTLFLQKGEERGATIKNGYEMLVIQAEESWNIWTSS